MSRVPGLSSPLMGPGTTPSNRGDVLKGKRVPFLGLSGIGHFYLRLHDASVPSPLLF